MKVQLERSFPMPAGADVVWRMLQDVEAVAGCMPGAKISERIDERHFKGTVSVRAGPATLLFRGDIEVMDLDPATRSLRLMGKGTDSSGTSGASMDLTASVQGDGASSNLVGKSEVAMSGKAAAFGGRVMNSVADQILRQFASNFAAQVTALAGAAAPAQAPDTGTAAGVQANRPAPSVPSGGHINALALLWGVIRDWFRAVFGRKAA
ncbi:MAG TPA: SRPBCC family protein [Burkholderiaceae bacterium]|nr:SRPBCC family protein [Burkholderiaceae bacterium]